MEQHLVQQANATPDALAVIENDTKLSYRQLIARADILAQALEERAIKSAEPICIFLSPGPQQVVAQVAVLRAGGSCVPIEPSVPSLRVTGMRRNGPLSLQSLFASFFPLVLSRSLLRLLSSELVVAVCLSNRLCLHSV